MARQARAASGRTQSQALVGLAAGAIPTTPATNVATTPDIMAPPLTPGDGVDLDEGTQDSPFDADTPAIAPEGP